MCVKQKKKKKTYYMGSKGCYAIKVALFKILIMIINIVHEKKCTVKFHYNFSFDLLSRIFFLIKSPYLQAKIYLGTVEHHFSIINSLPDEKMFDLIILKASADDKSQMARI